MGVVIRAPRSGLWGAEAPRRGHRRGAVRRALISSDRTGGGTVLAHPTRPLASPSGPAVACCRRSTSPLTESDRQWQTRREAGTQSHGPHAGSRAAEQEVDRGGPQVPACAACPACGHDPRCGRRGAARSSRRLPPLTGQRPPSGARSAAAIPCSTSWVSLLDPTCRPPWLPAPCAPRSRDDAPRARSVAPSASS